MHSFFLSIRALRCVDPGDGSGICGTCAVQHSFRDGVKKKCKRSILDGAHDLCSDGDRSNLTASAWRGRDYRHNIHSETLILPLVFQWVVY